ncbi:MAG: DUF2461 domain-containing protein [Prevotellaceae bacterium]|jgi:uncharacterized protein (TIGR02453 family)|nr:DUF2461 domain-containing protein [Prevotellaceae bacterium]
MNAQHILHFLAELRDNNNREWFAENKDKYLQAKSDFEQIVTAMIARIADFDKEIAGLQAKDCIFRIYRDTRFHDKTPYKNHLGAYICAGGGRKSERSGYYFHLELGNSMLSGGLWSPQPAVLKAVRQAVYENIDEFKEIVENPTFSNTFVFGEDEQLKTVPRGFPKDFADADYLKHKHYTVYRHEPDSFFAANDWFEKTIEIFRIMQPLHRFLNYTVDEVLDL